MGLAPKYMRSIQFNIEDPYGYYAERVDADKLVEFVKRVHANTLIVFARDAWGRVFYDGSRLYPRHPRTRLDVAELTRKAREQGINVIIMVAHTANRYIYNLHPDWAQRTMDGEVIVLEHVPMEERVRDPHWPQICPNSPALREYFYNEVREALEKTGAAGVLLDSFRYMPDLPKACYCRWCRERFREETGMELPDKIDEEDEAYRKAWWWRYSVLVRAISYLKEALRSVDPNAVLFYNNHPAGWAGRANVVVELARDVLDGVFAEASETDVKGPGFYTFITKLSKAAVGDDSKPVLVTRNAFLSLRIVQSPPEPTIRHGLWEIVAAGGMPAVTVFSSQFFEDPRYEKAVEKVYEAVEKIEDYLVAAKPVEYAAVIYSNINHEWYLHRNPEYYVSEVKGISMVFMHNHIPWNLIADHALEDPERLRRYRVIVAANTGILSDRAVEALRQYVEEGGVLVATHEFGVRRPDHTHRHALALQDLMGLRYEGRQLLGYYYMHLADGGLWEGLPRSIPFGDVNVAFRKERYNRYLGEVVKTAASGAKLLARLQLARSEYGFEYTLGRSLPPPGHVTEMPGIAVNKHGKGTIIYYAARLGLHYDRLGHPDYASLLLRPLGEYAPKPPVTAKAPDTVQLEAYRQKDRIIIHLVNHTCNQKFHTSPMKMTPAARQPLPGFFITYSVHPTRTLIPVYGIEVEADVEPGDYVVHEPLRGRTTSIRAESKIRYRLDKLEDYAMIVIEPKK